MIKYANYKELAEFCCIPTEIEHLCLSFVYYRTRYAAKTAEADTGKPLPTRHEKDQELSPDAKQEETEKFVEYDPDGMLVPAGYDENQYDYFQCLQDKVNYPLDDTYDTVSDFIVNLETNLRSQTIIRSEVIHETGAASRMADFIDRNSGVEVYGMERWTTLFAPVAEKYLLPMFQLINWDNPEYVHSYAAWAFHVDKHTTYYQKGAGEDCTFQLLREFGYDLKRNPFDMPGISELFSAKMRKEYVEKWEKLLREYWAWVDTGCPDLPGRTPVFSHDN